MNENPLEPPPGNDGDSEMPGDSEMRLVVPDDARELARDLEAWRREERWLRRRRRAQRLVFTRRWHEHGISGPLIALILVGVALLGATISVLAPRESHPPTPPVPLRLAAPTAAVGTVGGLLPDAVLKVDKGSVTVRDLRPSVIAIVAPGCDCHTAVSMLARAAATNALSVYLVGTQAQADQLEQLAGATSEGDVQALIDVTFALVDTYPPQGLTVIPVHADGVTAAVVPDYTGDPKLGPVLVGLRQAGPASHRAAPTPRANGMG